MPNRHMHAHLLNDLFHIANCIISLNPPRYFNTTRDKPYTIINGLIKRCTITRDVLF